MRARLFTLLLLLAAITAPSLRAATPASTATASSPLDVSPYPVLAALETRVATIGFRLTTANALWCPALQPQFGWIWGDPRLYDDKNRSEALAAYAARDSDAPFVAAIAPGSPASAAGLRAGDPLLGIGDGLVPPPGADAFSRIDALEILFATRPPDQPATLYIGAGQKLAIAPVAGCASDFRVEARDAPTGGADGRLVRISAGLAQYATDDAELAATIAHELAHNILRHPARLTTAGVDRGLLKQFGRSARLVRQTEVEADRLSIWLLYGAGYDPEAAPRFWRAFGKRKGPVLFQPGTHPRWQARVRAMEEEIAKLHAAVATAAPPVPPLVANPPPLE